MTATSTADPRDWVLANLEQGISTPTYRDIPGDLDTPTSTYLKLRSESPSFLLESVERGESVGRYSFVGAAPRLVARLHNGHATITAADGKTTYERYSDPLDYIVSLQHRFPIATHPLLPPFQGGTVGYLAYDAAANFEKLPVPTTDTLGVPEAVFVYCDEIVVFDHAKQIIRLVTLARSGKNPSESLNSAEQRLDQLSLKLKQPINQAQTKRERTNNTVTQSMTQDEFETHVRRSKEYIAAGDVIQVLPSIRFSRDLNVDAFEVYRQLRRVNPSPYMFFLDLEDLQLAGTSPEMLLQAVDGTARTRPIAGTRPRGSTSDEDSRLALDLMKDPKELAEHVMLVDLGRNDLGRVSLQGTVSVDSLMKVERFSHVMHIVSEVSGKLDTRLRGIDALRACFPAGTLTGAPKIRAMELIAEMENMRRGPYGGAIGYISHSGDVDTAIIIRTMVARAGKAHVQAGAGIVADSVPSSEYQECLNKARPVLQAIELAEEENDAPDTR
jgi:anthranilate synthase component 1